MKENSLKLAKERSRRYSAQTITDADCVDDIALLANAPVQAETLLQSGMSSCRHRPTCQCTQDNICALIKEATSPH